jgi:2-(1,2-epoxy-1,2-dihydrophenyl)acetyl-CoA isomerase
MAGVTYDLRDGVATLTLDEPEVRNAVSAAIGDGLLDGLGRAAAEAGAVILTGSGSAFCAGANLASGIATKPTAVRDMGETLERYYHPLIRSIRDLPIPILTAVNGPAVGLGCAFALMGDLVIMSERAYFLFGFSRVGLIPDGGATHMLARTIGRVRTMEILLLDQRISAADALAWGIVNRVVAEGDHLPVATALASQLAKGAAQSTSVTRRMVWMAIDETHERILQVEREEQRLAGNRPEFEEGLRAFRERRPPDFGRGQAGQSKPGHETNGSDHG